jgi:hypothetical protein
VGYTEAESGTPVARAVAGDGAALLRLAVMRAWDVPDRRLNRRAGFWLPGEQKPCAATNPAVRAARTSSPVGPAGCQ